MSNEQIAVATNMLDCTDVTVPAALTSLESEDSDTSMMPPDLSNNLNEDQPLTS